MARPIYKQFPFARTALCGLFLLGLMAFPQLLRAADANTAFTVEGVEVDVTAKNAVLAREKAMEEAQTKAYQMLAERLLTPEEVANLKIPDPITLSSLVQDFEVMKEQASKVRYKGTYTVRFRPNALKSQMASQGKSLPDLSKKPVLVLPVWAEGGSNLLWSPQNPWMNAWRSMPMDKSLLQPTVLPLGDAQDVTKASDGEGLEIDPMGLQEMASRYGADDAVIVMAETIPTETTQGALSISLYENGFEGPNFVQKIIVDQLPEETPDALYARAAAKVKSVLRGDWRSNKAYVAQNPSAADPTQEKTQPVFSSIPVTRPALGPTTNYDAIAKFSSVQDWVRLKNTIDKIYGMQSVMVKGLKPREATIDMRYAGDVRALQLALQNAGITLRGGGNAPYEIFMGPAPQTNIYR